MEERTIQLHEDKLGKLVRGEAGRVFKPFGPLLGRDRVIGRMLLEGWYVSQSLCRTGHELQNDSLRHMPVWQVLRLLVQDDVFPLDLKQCQSLPSFVAVVKLVEVVIQFSARLKSIEDDLQEALANLHVSLQSSPMVRRDDRLSFCYRDPLAGDVHHHLPLGTCAGLKRRLEYFPLPSSWSSGLSATRLLHGTLHLVLCMG
mmetsp:Transcript_48311/g.113032  ORF Transcript_48311/g.113032 Transcript_48311/m.113032 type:complete len:201 (-) Transcript_48311:1413-2015(-)